MHRRSGTSCRTVDDALLDAILIDPRADDGEVVHAVDRALRHGGNPDLIVPDTPDQAPIDRRVPILHMAARRAHRWGGAVIDVLLRAGARADATFTERGRPVGVLEMLPWDAAGPSMGPVVATLASAGADPRLPDGGDQRPLHRAARAWDAEAVAVLLDHGVLVDDAGMDILHVLADDRANDDVRDLPRFAASIRRLVGSGMPPDAMDGVGRTPFDHAVMETSGTRDRRSALVAECLLMAGADPFAGMVGRADRRQAGMPGTPDRHDPACAIAQAHHHLAIAGPTPFPRLLAACRIARRADDQTWVPVDGPIADAVAALDADGRSWLTRIIGAHHDLPGTMEALAALGAAETGS